MEYKGDLSKAPYFVTYIQLFKVVDCYDDVLKNAKQYQHDLKNDECLIKKLTNVQHWYYFKNEQIFAPSKFIGYKANGADLYEEYASKGMSGTETEPILKKWFVKLDRGFELEQ